VPLLGMAAQPAATSTTPPTTQSATLSAPTPTWQTELPHGGQLAQLSAWWQQFDDPALPVLIAAAQAASPDLASATSRIAQADATRVAAGAALLPQLDGSLSASRGRQTQGLPLAGSATASLQAGWELDLFGGRRAAQQAALARLAGAQADWHEARVSLAAEVAEQLLALRVCEQLALDADTEARSRAETARLTTLAQRAGFEAPASAALAQANAAQAALAARARQVQCGQALQALVALTGLDIAALRPQLAPRSAQLPQPATLAAAAWKLPAQALAQRPDVFSRARALEAAAADVSDSRAQELPRISLAGSLGAGSQRSAGVSSSGSLWSIGPLQVTLPLFDAGARRAGTDAARARYDAALADYQGRLRQALREVEDALLRLQDGVQRRADARAAVAGFAQALAAAEQRQQAGLASRLELEDSRRSLLQSRSQQTDTEREQVAAWIALYRALGGGWTPPAPAAGGGRTPTPASHPGS
jgi:NodT family efflux transporter outer membrane factor (OMF) lipoprotein